MAVSSPQLARQLYAGRAPYPLVIGGAEVSTGSSFAAIDPSTGSEWATLTAGRPGRGRGGGVGRRRCIRGLAAHRPGAEAGAPVGAADAIEDAAETWEQLLPTENGRPCREVAIADIPAATGIFRYFAGHRPRRQGLHGADRGPSGLTSTPPASRSARLPRSSPGTRR